MVNMYCSSTAVTGGTTAIPGTTKALFAAGGTAIAAAPEAAAAAGTAAGTVMSAAEGMLCCRTFRTFNLALFSSALVQAWDYWHVQPLAQLEAAPGQPSKGYVMGTLIYEGFSMLLCAYGECLGAKAMAVAGKQQQQLLRQGLASGYHIG